MERKIAKIVMLIKESFMRKVIICLTVLFGMLLSGFDLVAQDEIRPDIDSESAISRLKDTGYVIVLIPNSMKKNELLGKSIKNQSGKKRLVMQQRLDKSLEWRDMMYYSIHDAFDEHFDFCKYVFVLDSDMNGEDTEDGKIEILIDRSYNKESFELPEFYMKLYSGISSSGQLHDDNWYCSFSSEIDNKSYPNQYRVEKPTRSLDWVIDAPSNFFRFFNLLIKGELAYLSKSNTSSIRRINLNLHKHHKSGRKLFKKR